MFLISDGAIASWTTPTGCYAPSNYQTGGLTFSNVHVDFVATIAELATHHDARRDSHKPAGAPAGSLHQYTTNWQTAPLLSMPEGIALRQSQWSLGGGQYANYFTVVCGSLTPCPNNAVRDEQTGECPCTGEPRDGQETYEESNIRCSNLGQTLLFYSTQYCSGVCIGSNNGPPPTCSR